MFDIRKLEKELQHDIEIHTYDFKSKNEKYISFYHKRSKFYYKVNILTKDSFILLDFHEIYNKKDFSHGRRIEMSVIAHRLKKIIKDTSSHRVRLLSGVSKISWDWLIIENVEEYLKRNTREYVFQHKNRVIELYEESIILAKKFDERKDYRYDFYLCGEDGFYLFDLMDELGIAKIEEKRKVDLRLEFIPAYAGRKKAFVENMEKGLREMGFQIQLYHKLKTP